MSKQSLHIALATDQGYFSLAMVAIMSLLKTNPRLDVSIHLLDTGINSDSLDYCREVLAEKGCPLHIYDVKDIKSKLGIEVPDTISVSSYTRLFIADILPADVGEVLYIDCDTMFTGDISELLDFDFEDNYVAGVKDAIPGNSYRREIGIPRNEPYLNAGVLYIPLSKWRSEKMTSRFLRFLAEHDGKVHHHDQGIINAVCAAHKAILNPRYNLMSNYISFGASNVRRLVYEKKDEPMIAEAISNPAILHFTGVHLGRPWTDDCIHPFKTEFMNYFRMIPGSKIWHVESSTLQMLEKNLFRHLPFTIFMYAMRGLHNFAWIKHQIQA